VPKLTPLISKRWRPWILLLHYCFSRASAFLRLTRWTRFAPAKPRRTDSGQLFHLRVRSKPSPQNVRRISAQAATLSSSTIASSIPVSPCAAARRAVRSGRTGAGLDRHLARKERPRSGLRMIRGGKPRGHRSRCPVATLGRPPVRSHLHTVCGNSDKRMPTPRIAPSG
jgi:hypothetical protein